MADKASAKPKSVPASAPMTLAEWALTALEGQLYLAKVMCVAHGVTMTTAKPADEWADLLKALRERRIG